MRKDNQKMTIRDISLTYAKLSEVVKEKKVFSGEVNLAIAKNTLTLETELKNFEKSKESLVNKFVHKDEKGNPESKNNEYVFTSDEDKTSYIKSVEELLEAEIEVEVHKVKYELLEDEKHDTPTPADLIAMDFMLDY